MLRSFLRSLPNVRGKQRLAIWVDRFLGPARCIGRDGVVIEGFSSSTQDQAFLRPVSENPLLEECLRQLPRKGVFVDCGANCGFYSAMAAKHLDSEGVVVSIEPSAREFRRLLYAKASNEHQCQWITIQAAATESMQLVGVDCQVGHTGMNQIARPDSKNRADVSIGLTLDFVLQTVVGNRKVDLLKIDVEGFEGKVLRGLTESLQKRSCERILVEITDRFLRLNGDSKESLYQELQKYDYVPTINSSSWQFDELFVLRPSNR
jgi:FkbM family methyltransferase